MSSAITAPTETRITAAAQQPSEFESLQVAIVHHWFVTLGDDRMWNYKKTVVTEPNRHHFI